MFMRSRRVHVRVPRIRRAKVQRRHLLALSLRLEYKQILIALNDCRNLLRRDVISITARIWNGSRMCVTIIRQFRERELITCSIGHVRAAKSADDLFSNKLMYPIVNIVCFLQKSLDE